MHTSVSHALNVVIHPTVLIELTLKPCQTRNRLKPEFYIEQPYQSDSLLEHVRISNMQPKSLWHRKPIFRYLASRNNCSNHAHLNGR